MKCYVCGSLSFNIICKNCKKLLVPSPHKQMVNNIEVISLFEYETLSQLLHTKHTPEGYRIYNSLANLTLRPFIKTFIENYKKEVYIVGVDEKVKKGYSHTAILTHSLKMDKVKVKHSKLMAQNSISYSGKPLEYRLKNPRNFKYSGKKEVEIILVDDLITTGTTIKEAFKVLKKENTKPLFAITLAYVLDKTKN